MNYHVVIQTERRKAPRELALSIQGQLHTMGTGINDMTNVVYAASWDGISPWIVVLKGNIADLKMAYAGWPMIDQATWQAANPVVV